MVHHSLQLFSTISIISKTIEPYASRDELYFRIKIIEKKLYKNKIIQNGPRRIDIDIIFFNALKFSHENLVIPHPRASSRDFVLFPLCDINPFYFHPV